MKRTRWIVLLAWTFSAIAAGDVVFTKDGREIEGQVTQADGIVTVTTPEGGTIEIPKEDVLGIAVEPPEKQEADLPPDYNPPVTDDLPDTPPDMNPAIDTDSQAPRIITPPTVSLDLDKITRPEPIAFRYMRLIAEATPDEAVELDRTLQIWQGHCHDRLRKIGTDWVKPDVYGEKRETFTELMDNATEIAQELAQVDDDDEDADDTRARLTRQHEAAMLRAANMWADPEIGRFLKAVAYYQAGDYDNAADEFNYLRRAYPLITAYHQGYGLAAMEVPGDELDALAAFINALSLEPDSQPMLNNLLAGIDNVPGHEARSDVFQQALEMRNTYRQSALDARRPQQLSWAMPTSRAWLCRNDSLPMPPCDRIVYRQGWAIPVAQDTLLIDRAVVRDAERVFIQIDDDTLVPATALSTNSLKQYLPTMAMVQTQEATFTPVPVAAEPDYDTGRGVTFTGVGLYVEMGTEERSVQSLISEMDEKWPADIVDTVSAGEGSTAVFDLEDQLVGFLMGKTDYLEDGGGDGKFVPLSQPLRNSLLRIARTKPSTKRSLREAIEPVSAEGTGFHVYAISTETFEN